MNPILCDLGQLLVWLVNIYTLVLLVYAVFSWIPDLRGGRLEVILATFVEPVLIPIRRIIPPIGGIDIAFLVLLLVLQLVIRPLLNQFLVSACFSTY
jgi:YggT family protein